MSNFRNLEVPYFSQRENTTVWHRRYTQKEAENKRDLSLVGKIVEGGASYAKTKDSCNITSLAMLLHYFGVTSDIPDEMMRKVFNCFG